MYWIDASISISVYARINSTVLIILFIFLTFQKRYYLFIFRERGRKGEREGEKHQCVRHTSRCPHLH